jgi:hypothetical protein
MRKEKKLVNLFKKKFKLCYCYEYSREFRAKHIRHSFLQHLFVVLLGDSIDASGKSFLKMRIKAHISSKKIKLQNYISKNFPKVEYLYCWRLNERNIWVEIYLWLIKNKVVLQETKKGLVLYPKSKQEEAEKKLKFYNQI